MSRPNWLVPCASALLLAGCGPRQTAPTDTAPSVIVAHPRTTPVSGRIELTGTVAPSATVDLIARTAGTIRSKQFVDGSYVTRGQLLFRIEPDSSDAQLRLNAARETQARLDYARQQRLLAQDAAAVADVEASKANLDQAAANTQIARIALRNTIVRAPFNGYIGASLADVGAYVGGAGAPSKLATLQRLEPVYVAFTLGERDVLRILASGKAGHSAINGYPVRIALQGESGYPHAGRLDFANKAIDSATGSLQARAVVANGPRTALLPGLFAKVRIETGDAAATMLLPARTIQSDPLSDYVLLLDAKGIVQRRDIRTGRDFGRNREVLAGLAPSDRVIVEGSASARIGQAAHARLTTLSATDSE